MEPVARTDFGAELETFVFGVPLNLCRVELYLEIPDASCRSAVFLYEAAADHGAEGLGGVQPALQRLQGDRKIHQELREGLPTSSCTVASLIIKRIAKIGVLAIAHTLCIYTG